MTFTISFAWWWMPTVISLVGFLWVMTRPSDAGHLNGIETLFYLIPMLLVSCIAWAIAGALK